MKTTNAYVIPSRPSASAVICYLTIIGWLAVYFGMYKKNKGLLAFHLRQSLLLHIGLFTVNILSVLKIWALYPAFLVIILGIILLILWGRGILDAANAKEEPIPLVGDWAQNLFKRI